MFGIKKDAYSLFRAATENKKKGDIDAAIDLLKQAKITAEKEDMIYTINDYLRLPLYLQEAGKKDEAWREFQSLINNGYPNQLKVNGLQYFDLARIYDKMRLFLQREGKAKQAVEFGLMSYCYELQAIRIQRNDQDSQIAKIRIEEAESYITEDSINKMLEPLLKKAGKQETGRSLTVLVKTELIQNDKIDFRNLTLKVREVLEY